MKKFIGITALFLMLSMVLCACGGKKTEDAASVIYGMWYNETEGVGTTVSFGEDKVMTSFCSVVDKAKADEAGVNINEVDGKNGSCFYSVVKNPDLSGLSAEEQELLAGKMAIVTYYSEEEMKNSLPSGTVYFTVSGETLTITGPTGIFDAQTGIPVYSDIVFTKSK